MKAGLKIWQTNYTSQSGGASQRGELFSYGIDNIWAADLVEIGKFSKMEQGDQISPDGDRCFFKVRVDSSPERQARANCRRCFPIHICGKKRSGAEQSEAKTKDALDR